MHALALALTGLALTSQAPRLELESRACAPPGGRARVCARVVDDRGVARVRAVFRAAGTAGYWAAEMAFDGARYCAWLPRPASRTKAIEYYVEAFDVDFEMSRTRVGSIASRPDCADDPASTGAPPTVVSPTTAGQPPLPPGFDPLTATARDTPTSPSPRR